MKFIKLITFYLLVINICAKLDKRAIKVNFMQRIAEVFGCIDTHESLTDNINQIQFDDCNACFKNSENSSHKPCNNITCKKCINKISGNSFLNNDTISCRKCVLNSTKQNNNMIDVKYNSGLNYNEDINSKKKPQHDIKNQKIIKKLVLMKIHRYFSDEIVSGFVKIKNFIKVSQIEASTLILTTIYIDKYIKSTKIN